MAQDLKSTKAVALGRYLMPDAPLPSADFVPPYQHPNRLTVSEALGFLFRHQLRGKPSARPFNSNRKALCKTIGHIWYDELNDLKIGQHVNARAREVGSQTIKHEIKLLSMSDHSLRRWKRKRYTLDGFHFATLMLPEENPTIDVKRPRTKPRKRPVSPVIFSRWIEHCSESLKRRSYFAMDTGLSPCELKKLKPSHYNATTDCLDLQRGKSGEVGSIPVSNRCRPIILEAIYEGREFILDFTNHDKEVEATRKRAGVYFHFGRDLRTTYYNSILKSTGWNYKAAQRAMLHSDPRTGPAHYEVDDGTDLRPAVRDLEKNFS